MHTNTKIYIAGHKGLVGSAIMRHLRYKGYTNLLYKTHNQLDLTHQQSVADFFATEQPECVVLAAAKVGGIVANNRYRADFIYQNLAIQNNVIHQSYLHGVKKLLFLGSSCIYPKWAPQPMHEECLLTGALEYTNEPYAIAKIAGMKLCESYNLQYGTNYITAMPTNLYGVHDNFDLAGSHVLPALLRKMHLAKLLSEGQHERVIRDLQVTDTKRASAYLAEFGVFADSVEIWGSGKPKRDLLYADDAANACLFILENVNFADTSASTDTEVRNTHINIGSGDDISIQALAECIQSIVGFTGQLRFNAEKSDGTMKKLMDVTKLRALGWRHTVSLKEGIQKTYDWYRQHTEAS